MFAVNNIHEQYNELLKELDYKNIITVDNKYIKELFQTYYIINYNNNLYILDNNIQYDLKEDEFERQNILKEIRNKLYLFDDDIHTRRFVIQMKYINSELASCIPLIQFIVRDNKLFMYVFIRSQNIENNFLYDNQTFLLAYKTCLDYLQKYNINNAYISVAIISLHKIIGDNNE